MSPLNSFLAGALCMGFFTITLYFLKFWKTTRDRLFLFFALAFALLMIERLLRELLALRSEWLPFVYAIRLAAFASLLIAIIDKNRRL